MVINNTLHHIWMRKNSKLLICTVSYKQVVEIFWVNFLCGMSLQSWSCGVHSILRRFLLSVQIYVRALFDYDPSTDDLISCREAGLAFSSGDILHIMAKDDAHWWQARHWSAASPSHTLQLAGLIPSAELLEWKTSCSTIERAKRKHTAKIGSKFSSCMAYTLN